MITAEELFERLNTQDGVLPKWAKEFAIEFAKMHVENALEAASNKVIVNEETQYDEYDVPCLIAKIDKDSILTAYPISNIK